MPPQDEDDAFTLALAESLLDQAKHDTEMADLEKVGGPYGGVEWGPGATWYMALWAMHRTLPGQGVCMCVRGGAGRAR